MPAPPPLAFLAAATDRPVRDMLREASSLGFRFIQLSATHPGLRPRDLGESARRDLRATLRRSELDCCGVDLWIPPEHFADAARCDRAVGAVADAIRFCADLGGVPLSVDFPPQDEPAAQEVESVITALLEQAEHFGVPIADHALPVGAREGSAIGVDPAACLGMGLDPAGIVNAHATRLVSARLSDLSSAGMRVQPGQGRLDRLGFQVALSVAGYARPVVLDTRHWSASPEAVTNAAASWFRSVGV